MIYKKLFMPLIIYLLSTGCSIPNKILNIKEDKTEIETKDKKEILQKADILNNRGIKAYKNREYREAISYYKQSLNIKKRFLKENSLSIATTYNNIGLAYKALGDSNLALKYIIASLKIRENILGKDSSIVAESYNNLGTLYRSLGDTDRALEYTQKTIDIKEDIIKKEKRDMAIAYNNIAVLYEQKKDYKLALKNYFKALDINREISENDRLTKHIYKKIATLYYTMGEYDKAKKFFKSNSNGDIELKPITVKAN